MPVAHTSPRGTPIKDQLDTLHMRAPNHRCLDTGTYCATSFLAADIKTFPRRPSKVNMAFPTFFALVTVLLAAWNPLAVAQETPESDVKSIPLRTHSLQTVRAHANDK